MKKLTAMLLVLLMMAMPFAGLADTMTYAEDALAAGRSLTTTIDCSLTAPALTGDPTVDQVIADLVNAMQLVAVQQNGEGGFSLGLKQASGEVVPVLTMSAATADDVLYLSSNLLAGGTVAVSTPEIVPVLNRLVDLFTMLGMFSEEDAAEMKAMLTEMESMVEAEMSTAMAAANVDIDLTKLDLSAMEGVMAKIMEKIVIEPVTMQPKNCDPAAVVATATLTPDEMKELLVAALQMVKANPDLTASFADSFMSSFNASAGTQMTFDEVIDLFIAELGNEQIYAGDVTYRIWMDENNGICAMEAVAPMDEENNMTLNYSRLTLNDGVAHSGIISIQGVDLTVNVVEKGELLHVNFALAEQGVNYIYVAADIVDRSNGDVVDCDVTITIDINMGGDIDYVYDEATGEWQFVETEPSILTIVIGYTDDAMRTGVDFNETEVITLTVAGTEFFRITAVTETGIPAASITEGQVVRLASLSDADFANWFVGMYNNLASWLMTVVTALPASVTELLMSGM